MTDETRSASNDDAAEIDELGAAPSRPVGRSGGSAPPRRPSSRRLRLPFRNRPLLLLALLLVGAVLLTLVPAFAAGWKKTPRNMVGISYGGGPLESARFQRIVMPGSGLFFNGFYDPLYLYPSDQQSYIVSKVQGQGTIKAPDSIISPSRDRVQIEFQVAVYFKLNIDRLRAFHEELGLRYQAYTSSGWNNLIQDTFRQQIENALQEETRKYDVADLFGSSDALTTTQQSVETKLSDRLITALGQPFFCGPTYKPGGNCSAPTFIIKKIDIPADVVKAFQDNRTSQIQVLTAQNQVAQRTAEAQAIQALNVGLAQAGMPYVLLKAIESGQITFWVLPEGNGFTLQAPSTPGAPAPATPSAPTTSNSSSSGSSSSSSGP